MIVSSIAKNSKSNDEYYTPDYAVEPIIKYLPKGSTVWLPFDKECSRFNVLLKKKRVQNYNFSY